MTTWNFHVFDFPRERIPVHPTAQYGAPPLGIRTFPAYAAIPAAHEGLEIAILQGAVDIGWLRRRVDRVRAGCLIPRVQIEHGFRTVQPFNGSVRAGMVVRMSVAHCRRLSGKGGFRNYDTKLRGWRFGEGGKLADIELTPRTS